MRDSLLQQRSTDPEGYRRRVESLRGFVRAHLANGHSLRSTAAEVGMSPGGIKGFAEGAEAYFPTVHKLERWRATLEAEASTLGSDAETSRPAESAREGHGDRWASDARGPGEPLARFESLDKADEVEVLREAARLLVEQTNLRFAARALGVKPGALYRFVNGGGRPYGKLITAVRAWYIRSVLNGELVLTGSRARLLLNFFLTAFSLSERSRAEDELLSAIERIHTDAGKRIPLWLLDSREQQADGTSQERPEGASA